MLIYHKTPQYYETDMMGIIHHSNHIRWFEEARLAYMKQMGVSPIVTSPDSGILCPVVSAEAQYKKMIRVTDTAEITIRLTQYNGFRFTFAYEIRNADGDLCCTGTTALCFVDRDGRPFRMDKKQPRIHQLFCNALKKDTEPESLS